jgi:hypothetical protein
MSVASVLSSELTNIRSCRYMQSDTPPPAVWDVYVAMAQSLRCNEGSASILNVYVRRVFLWHREMRIPYIVFLHNNKYLCSVWLIDILRAAYICFCVHFTISCLFYLVVTIDWIGKHFIYLLSFPYSLSFFSVLYLLFPSLCSSIFSYTLSKTMDGISTALPTRWRRILPSLWINIGRGMKSVFYCMTVLQRRGEFTNTRIQNTSPRLPVPVCYIYWPAECRLENNRAVLWKDRLSKHDNLSIPFANWELLSCLNSTFHEFVFSRFTSAKLWRRELQPCSSN